MLSNCICLSIYTNKNRHLIVNRYNPFADFAIKLYVCDLLFTVCSDLINFPQFSTTETCHFGFQNDVNQLFLVTGNFVSENINIGNYWNIFLNSTRLNSHRKSPSALISMYYSAFKNITLRGIGTCFTIFNSFPAAGRCHLGCQNGVEPAVEHWFMDVWRRLIYARFGMLPSILHCLRSI